VYKKGFLMKKELDYLVGKAREKAFLILSVERVKRKITRKGVNNSTTRSKLRIKRIKSKKNLIKSMIHINNQTFN